MPPSTSSRATGIAAHRAGIRQAHLIGLPSRRRTTSSAGRALSFERSCGSRSFDHPLPAHPGTCERDAGRIRSRAARRSAPPREVRYRLPWRMPPAAAPAPSRTSTACRSAQHAVPSAGADHQAQRATAAWPAFHAGQAKGVAAESSVAVVMSGLLRSGVSNTSMIGCS